MEHNPKNIKDTILGKIRSEQILMRPRLYFTLQVVGSIILALCVFFISIFIVNFILFSLRINGHDAYLGFGPRGVEAFLRFFPWELLVLDAALVVALQWMLRQFRVAYQMPVLYLIGGLIAFSVIAGVGLDRGTQFNDEMLNQADQHQLGPFDEIYIHARRPPPIGEGFCHCIVTAISNNTITVQDSRSTTTLTVILPDDDDRATTTGLQVGDTVLVAGDRDGNTITAFGVRKVPADWTPRLLIQVK